MRDNEMGILQALRRRAGRLIMLSLIPGILLSGCAHREREDTVTDGRTKAELLSEITDTMARYRESREKGGTEPEEESGEQAEPLVLCTAGFEPGGNKEFTLVVRNAEDSVSGSLSFEITDSNTENAVYTGELTEETGDSRAETTGGAEREKPESGSDRDNVPGESYEENKDKSRKAAEDDSIRVFSGDFSELDSEGEYYIACFRAGGEGEDPVLYAKSGPFRIEESYYRELLKKHMTRLSENEERSGMDSGAYSDREARRGLYKQTADLLLSFEFFENKHLTEDGEEKPLPETLELSGDHLEMLLSTREESLNDDKDWDSGDDYIMSALLSEYAGDIRSIDENEGREKGKKAMELFSEAEKLFEDSEDTEEGPGALRFYAAAQLYRLTGEKKYRAVAEEWLNGDIEAVFSGAGPLPFGVAEGSIAYLTTQYKTGRELSDRLMRALLDRALILAREWDHYSTALSRKGELTKEMLERARTAILANCISQSVVYVQAAERSLSYLYGMSPEGEADALTEEGEAPPVLFILNGLADVYISRTNR